MKLYYYKDERGNFGDDLNPWLWDRLLPGFLDEDEKEWLVGIGTLLNHKLPATGKKHVFGAGYGYGAKPSIDHTYNFICVRGPKTAEALGLPQSAALTDPAILIRAVALPVIEKKFEFGFIPHHTSIGNFSWNGICSTLGFNFVNPEWPVDRILSELGKCKVVLCEAMHGAIVCDALRIPWIPIKCYSYISDFKWQDWLLTVDMQYEPIEIPSLFDIDRRSSLYKRQRNYLKHMLARMGISYRSLKSLPPRNSSYQLIDKATRELQLATRSKIYLSTDTTCNSLFEQYLEKLDVLKTLNPALSYSGESGMQPPKSSL